MIDDPVPDEEDPPTTEISPEVSAALPLFTLTAPLLPSLASPLRPIMEPELLDELEIAVEISTSPL